MYNGKPVIIYESNPDQSYIIKYRGFKLQAQYCEKDKEWTGRIIGVYYYRMFQNTLLELGEHFKKRIDENCMKEFPDMIQHKGRGLKLKYTGDKVIGQSWNPLGKEKKVFEGKNLWEVRSIFAKSLVA